MGLCRRNQSHYKVAIRTRALFTDTLTFVLLRMEVALERIVHKQPQYAERGDFLAGFVAMTKDGEVGAMSYRKCLQYSLHKDGVVSIVDAEYMVK